MSLQTDQELVQRSQQGELDAFNILVERHQGQVYNLAFRILGDGALAEDATQEAFMSAYRNIGRFRGGNLRAWLFRIATNSCYDLLRKRRGKQELSLEALEENPGSAVPSPQEEPDKYALRQELAAHIQKGLSHLPRDQRLCLILIDIKGLSYEEAAQVMRVNLGTVKSRLSRARGAMRDHLLTQRELLVP